MKKSLLCIICIAAILIAGCSQKTPDTNSNSALFVYEDETFRFEITQVDPDAADGYRMDLVFENKNAEHNVNVCLEEFTMQGCIINSPAQYLFQNNLRKVVSVSLNPSEVKKLTVYADWSELNRWNILQVDEIDFNLRVWNKNIQEDDIAYHHCTAYPTGLSPEEIVYPEPVFENSKIVLDTPEAKVVFWGIEESSEGNPVINYWVESKLDQTATFRLIEPTLNGKTIDNIFYVFYLNGGKRTPVQWEMTKFGISPDKVNQINMTLHIYIQGNEINYPFKFEV